MPFSIAKEFSGPNVELDEYYLGKIIKNEIDTRENMYSPGTPRVLLTVQFYDEDRRPLQENGEPITTILGINVKAGSGKKALLNQLWNAIFFENKGVPDGEEMDTDELSDKWFRFVWGMVENNFDHTSKPGFVKFAAARKKATAATTAKTKALEDDIDAA